MSNLAVNPAGTSSLCLRAGMRQWLCLWHLPLSDISAPGSRKSWRRGKLRSARPSAAESKMRIDFVQSRLAASFPASAQAPLRVLTGARRHSVFCFAFRAPVGLRLSQNKLENRGTERRTSFFRAPP